MSSLTTTSINSANGATNLTISTGNTSGPSLILGTSGSFSLRANSTTNTFFINTTATTVNTSLTVTRALSVANLTSNGIGIFSGNVFFTGTTSTFTSNISATSISLGTPSIASSGHSRLPNGLLIQWGTVSVNATTGSITFPTAFASNPYSVQVTSTSGASANAAGVTAVTTTTATVRSASTTTASTAYWLAIGV